MPSIFVFGPIFVIAGCMDDKVVNPSKKAVSTLDTIPPYVFESLATGDSILYGFTSYQSFIPENDRTFTQVDEGEITVSIDSVEKTIGFVSFKVRKTTHRKKTDNADTSLVLDTVFSSNSTGTVAASGTGYAETATPYPGFTLFAHQPAYGGYTKAPAVLSRGTAYGFFAEGSGAGANAYMEKYGVIIYSKYQGDGHCCPVQSGSILIKKINADSISFDYRKLGWGY